LDRYLVIVVGAGLGGLLRYLASMWIMGRTGGIFPAGTFVINLSGSFLIGLTMTLFTERFQPHPNLRLFLTVGLLGGYTTFSTFEYETLQAARGGGRWVAPLYALGSVVFGYLAVWLGAAIATRR